jgi:hypothetical protein
MKQYAGDVAVCGQDVDNNYEPDSAGLTELRQRALRDTRARNAAFRANRTQRTAASLLTKLRGAAPAAL